MASRADKLIEDFYALPQSEQVKVLEAIVPVGNNQDFDPAYRAELERRVQSVLDGTAVSLDGDEVMARMRAKYAAR